MYISCPISRRKCNALSIGMHVLLLKYNNSTSSCLSLRKGMPKHNIGGGTRGAPGARVPPW